MIPQIGDLSGYDLTSLLRRVQERFAVESRAQGNQIVLNCSVNLRFSCRMPCLELERIISNIIGNAVRYSGVGEILVRADIDDKGRLLIQVRDKGPGIPSNVVDSVLACRVIHGDSEESGWGLGLISCKEKLVAYAGDLKIYSDESKGNESGCVVEVIVPTCGSDPVSLRGVEPKYGGEFSKATKENISMIIVDDDVDHSSSLERILRRKDIRVNCCDSIEQAMALIREQEGSIVLCDGHMPDGGAERLLGALRDGDIKRYCAVMSGDSNDGLLYRFAALGAREFFAKPLDVERVIEWAKRLE